MLPSQIELWSNSKLAIQDDPLKTRKHSAAELQEYRIGDANVEVEAQDSKIVYSVWYVFCGQLSN